MIYGYCRVSSDEQGDKGESLNAQRELIFAIYPDAVVHEEVESAKDIIHRPVITALVYGAKASDLIVVKSFDRLTRSVKDLLDMIDYMRHAGIALISLKENIDTGTAQGRFFMTVLGAVSELERGLIGDRTRDVLRSKKRNGQKTGGHVPYGYECVDGNGLVVNKYEEERIQIMNRKYQAGISYNRIAKEMNSVGVSSKTGKRWTAQTVKQIINRTMEEK